MPVGQHALRDIVNMQMFMRYVFIMVLVKENLEDFHSNKYLLSHYLLLNDATQW